MRTEEIFLDLSKLSNEEIAIAFGLIPENSGNDLRIMDGFEYLHFDEYESWFVDTFSEVKNKKEINIQQFKELFQEDKQFNLKQVGITLEDASKALKFNIPTDLKVGQEIEANGFVLKVDREVKKWYKTKNINSKLDYPYNFNKLSISQLESIDRDLQVEEIIDQDFINLLEKHSK